MKYANNINDIANAFNLRPLGEEELEVFFCDETMEFRTGDKYKSPIQDICEAFQSPVDKNIFLLLGHKGCGKSTELNNMSKELKANGYKVITIHCDVDLDLINPVFTDILIMMGKALIEIAQDTGCELGGGIKEKLLLFWSKEVVESSGSKSFKELSAEAGIQARTPAFLASMIEVFVKIKSDLRFSTEKRIEYRTKITQFTSEWLHMLNSIADEITSRLEGKQPILIFEDLDKINPGEAWNIFSSHAATLSGVSFPVIYTFPIALSYDPRFASLEGYYQPKILPMIKQETISGQPYQAGIDVIIKIVEARADLGLFDQDVLEILIKKTGGSLRDLFSCIISAAHMAIRKNALSISRDDIDSVLKELKSSLTRRIERKHYAFLTDICKGNRTLIEDKAMLLEMLQANAVLEYNEDRWHNAHPLVRDFLHDHGLI